jgi:ADP-ribose pyrophosphatase
MTSWKTRSRRIVLSQPPWLVVEQHEVELPDGRVIPNWPWVITPDYINIVVEMENGEFLCFEQAKYGLPEGTLAIVGGYLQPGEDALAAARRELREETGCVAGEWIPLGRYLVDPNRGMANGHLFLARGARVVGEPIPDDLEEQTAVYLTRQELREALDSGEIEVLAWAAAVSLALQYTEKTRPA